MIDTVLERFCQVCGASIVGGRRDKKYCGAACKQKGLRLRRSKPAPVESTGTTDLKLFCGDYRGFTEQLRGQADVIITDPPYGNAYTDDVLALGEFATTVLRPGGWMLVLLGKSKGQLFECFSRWEQHPELEYVTTACYSMPGGNQAVKLQTSTGPRNIRERWKPILWFQKKGDRRIDYRRGGTWDSVEGSKSDSRNVRHEWEQSVTGFREMLFNWTSPADIICDPFMGSGTTGAASVETGRRGFIGIEKNPEAFEVAKRRLFGG